MKKLFAIEKNPHRGLFAFEWVVLAYMLLTLVVILFTWTKLVNPVSMLWGRFHFVAMTAALWVVYRLFPCRMTRFLRIVGQMSLLSWWYPDTYELNRIFPNLDHLFAAWEQQLFGCQPALLFSQAMPSPVVSELMDLGYASYFPMMLVVMLYFFFCCPRQLMRAAWILMASFMLYYVIFVFLPVTGPQYYYGAVGLDEIAKGIFPNVGDYFMHNMERLISPGYQDGLFYHMVESAHAAGERPTAAFPSSHVGISTILLLLCMQARSRRLTLILLPFFILLCLSTVYIQAHYVIDAIAGLITGVAFYYLFWWMSRNWKEGSSF